MSLQMALFHPSLWLSDVPLFMCTASSSNLAVDVLLPCPAASLVV